MLVVDSTVWIDFFAGNSAHSRPAVGLLQQLLAHGEVRIVVPDLVLFEVLRGFRHERDLRQARRLMETLNIEPTGSEQLALAAAEHYRGLRVSGYTVASSIDVWVASYCIENDYALLHHDSDFDAFERMRGLRIWQHSWHHSWHHSLQH